MGVFKGKHARVLTLMVSVTLVVVLSYIAITDDKEEEAKQKTTVSNSEIETVLNKDLKNDYPASVREVVKFYCRVLNCIYNEELSSKDEETLIDKECALFDEELLNNNKYNELLNKQRKEVEKFKKAQEAIFSYEVDTNENVKTWYHNDLECASVNACIKLSGSEFKTINEKFILRKDKKEQWKIVGWTVIKDKDNKK